MPFGLLLLSLSRLPQWLSLPSTSERSKSGSWGVQQAPSWWFLSILKGRRNSQSEKDKILADEKPAYVENHAKILFLMEHISMLKMR